MSNTMQVRWGVLRPGATVVGERGSDWHKVVTIERRGTTVSVLFWDGTRELHSEDAYARVLLHDQARPRRGVTRGSTGTTRRSRGRDRPPHDQQES